MTTTRMLSIWTEEDENPLIQEGLYIALSPGGKIKRHLIVGGNEMPLSDTTIAEELIQLTERSFEYLSAVIMTLYESLENVHNDPEGFSNYRKYINTVLREMEAANIVSGTLARTLLIDMEDEAIVNNWHGTDHVLETINKLYPMVTMPQTISCILDDLCDRIPVDQNFGIGAISTLAVTQILTFTPENTLHTQYFFRSEENYYLFLLQQYTASGPNIAKCQFCGRYFFPKTRKKTLYCDRIIKDGKTCKQLAPRLKRRELAAADYVVREFERCKKMLYVRLQRTGPDKSPSIIDITPSEYWAWLNEATAALNNYLSDQISQEEALAIIHVPKKPEMLGSNSAQLTLETAAP